LKVISNWEIEWKVFMPIVCCFIETAMYVLITVTQQSHNDHTTERPPQA